MCVIISRAYRVKHHCYCSDWGLWICSNH